MENKEKNIFLDNLIKSYNATSQKSKNKITEALENHQFDEKQKAMIQEKLKYYYHCLDYFFQKDLGNLKSPKINFPNILKLILKLLIASFKISISSMSKSEIIILANR